MVIGKQYGLFSKLTKTKLLRQNVSTYIHIIYIFVQYLIILAVGKQYKIDTGKNTHRINNRKLLICIHHAHSVSKLGSYKVNILQIKTAKGLVYIDL